MLSLEVSPSSPLLFTCLVLTGGLQNTNGQMHHPGKGDRSSERDRLARSRLALPEMGRRAGNVTEISAANRQRGHARAGQNYRLHRPQTRRK